ncbi:MAG: recombinase family protein [Bacillota bacterium]
MNAAIYLRVSSDEQAEHGHSLAFQREECVRRARELGATGVEVYSDEGVSGAVLARPGLDALRSRVRGHGVQAVVVWDPDRLARRLTHQLFLTEEIEAHCCLVFVNLKRDDSPEGQLFYQLRGAISQYEREKIRERTSAGRRQKARSGKLPFAMEPYGYRYDPGRSNLEVVEAEARVVQRLFRDYVFFQGGFSHLARCLTEEGMPTRRGAQAWHRQTIKQILMNPVYRGVYYANRRDMSGVSLNKYREEGKTWGRLRPQGDWIPVEVPAIVSQDLWQEAQETMERSRRLRHRSDYLLSGLLKCGACGGPMVGTRLSVWGKRVRHYTCRRSSSAKGLACQRSVKAEALEQAVWSRVTPWLGDRCLLERHLLRLRQTPGRHGRERAGMELERVQRSRKQILLAMELGLAAGADALSSLERLKEREGALLQGEPRATPGPGEEIEGVLSVLEAGLPLEVKRAIVRCLVAGIEVGERSVTLMARSTPEAGGICHRQ